MKEGRRGWMLKESEMEGGAGGCYADEAYIALHYALWIRCWGGLFMG